MPFLVLLAAGSETSEKSILHLTGSRIGMTFYARNSGRTLLDIPAPEPLREEYVNKVRASVTKVTGDV